MLDGKGITNDIKVYPEVGHSFANKLPAQPLLRIAGFGYNQAATDDAWARVFSFSVSTYAAARSPIAHLGSGAHFQADVVLHAAAQLAEHVENFADDAVFTTDGVVDMTGLR